MTLKQFPELVADPTTNEQKIIEWKERFEKKFREFNIMEWLDKNHPDGAKWPCHGAKIMDTLERFITKEVLGRVKTKP